MNDRGRKGPGAWIWALGIAFMLALVGGAVSAKKPQPPPPPPVEDPGDVGVIYIQIGNFLYAMDPDGTNVREVTLPEFRASIDYYPSRGLYGGERWFLQKRITKPYDWLPDGQARYELYAVSEGGKSVLLLSEHNFDVNKDQYSMSIGWTAHNGVADSKVSFVGRKWVGSWPEGGEVVEWGIYVATLDPQDLPGAAGPDGTGALELEWSLLPLEFTLNEGTGLYVYHEWAPDGNAIVYQDWFLPGRGIWVAEDHELGWTTNRIGGGGGPRWSNDGTRLALRRNADICIVDRDGTNLSVVVPDPPDTRKYTVAVAAPFWSPSDTHLIYSWMTIEKDPKPPGSPGDGTVETHRVYLTEDGGVNNLKLTAGTTWGWRE